MFDTGEELADIYYGYTNGEIPENKDNLIQTINFFNHLLDAGITSKEILEYIIKDSIPKEALEYNDIPDKFYENSLLEKNKFYYHRQLQIISPPPTKNNNKYYKEMKIRYTEEDLIKYFCRRFNIREDWIDIKKEIGSIRYLLKKYYVFNFMEPVDFILLLIDFVASKSENEVRQILDLDKYSIEYAEYAEKDTKNAEVRNKNKIIWR